MRNCSMVYHAVGACGRPPTKLRDQGAPHHNQKQQTRSTDTARAPSKPTSARTTPTARHPRHRRSAPNDDDPDPPTPNTTTQRRHKDDDTQSARRQGRRARDQRVFVLAVGSRPRCPCNCQCPTPFLSTGALGAPSNGTPSNGGPSIVCEASISSSIMTILARHWSKKENETGVTDSRLHGVTSLDVLRQHGLSAVGTALLHGPHAAGGIAMRRVQCGLAAQYLFCLFVCVCFFFVGGGYLKLCNCTKARQRD